MFRTLRFYHSFFKFLSTPSARRATSAKQFKSAKSWISIHALREEGDVTSPDSRLQIPDFYPRPPRGGRHLRANGKPRPWKFLSTPSARRATVHRRATHRNQCISIHALREEGDTTRRVFPVLRSHFYPRPPRGGRQQKQRENPLLLSHYTPPCTNCKEMSANQTAKSHRYLRKRLVFWCEVSRKTMCAAGSHWPDIKRSARCLGQTPGAVQRARPWSGSCCPAGRTADCPRQGRSRRSALL